MKEQNTSDSIIIKDLLQKYFAKWYFFVAGILIALILAFLFVKMTPKIYRVTSTLMVKNKSPETAVVEKILNEMGLPRVNSEIEDEIGILTSRNLIEETIKQLDFGILYYFEESLRTRLEYHNAPFTVHVDSSHVQAIEIPIKVEILKPNELRITAEGSNVNVYNVVTDELDRKVTDFSIDARINPGEVYEDRNVKFSIELDEYYQNFEKVGYYFTINTYAGLAKQFERSLEISAAGDESNIINLTSEGPVIPMQLAFLNKLMDAYINREKTSIESSSKKALGFIEEQLQEVRDSLARATGKTTQTKMSSGIDILNTARNLEDRLIRLEDEKSEIDDKLRYYSSTLATIQTSSGDLNQVMSPSAVGIRDNYLDNLLLKLQDLSLEKASLEQEVLPGHPSLTQIDNQISSTQNTILQNVTSSVRQVENILDSKTRQIRNIESEIRRLPVEERRYLERMREQELNNSKYKDLIKNKGDIELAIKTNIVNKEVLDKAFLAVDSPVSPNVMVIFILAMIMGFAIPLAIITIQNFFDTKISSQDDLQMNTNIPVIGFISQYTGKEKNYITTKDATTPLAESFRAVRVNLQYLVTGKEKKVLGLTSSNSGEGKTFCSTNLSAVIAQSGKKTLLVDVDLRRPRVATYFRNLGKLGLSDYLNGEVDDIQDIIYPTHIENLDVIPSGPICNNPLDLLGNNNMEDLIQLMKEHYDQIILDTPPVGLVSDYLILMHLTNFNIYVVRHNSTDVNSLRWINELYDTEKIKNLGMLINDVKSVRSYGYSDGGSYYREKVNT